MIIGIGNSGRKDDGLGWFFLDELQKKSQFKGKTIYRYQLQVEDAELIHTMQQVVFVDAFKGNLENGFRWVNCEPVGSFTFTSHILPPEAILFLCQDLYHKAPICHILQLQGEAWNLGLGLSALAQHNLDKALLFFDQVLTGMEANETRRLLKYSS